MPDPTESHETGLSEADLTSFGNDVLNDINPDRESGEPADRERDEHGRFVAKPTSNDESPTTDQEPTDKPLEPTARTPVEVPPNTPPTGDPVAPTTPTAATPAPGPSAPDLSRAPASWKPDVAAHWATLPESVRAEAHRREEDFHKGIESYKTKSTFADAMVAAIQPFYPSLQANGIDPVAHAHNLMSMHHRLATGDRAARVAMIGQIARDFGLTPADFGGPGFDPNVDAPILDPMLKALQDEQARDRTRLANLEAERQAEKKARITSEVTAFAKDKPYFDEVANDIARFIQTGAYPDLPSAYQAAIWANPTTRTKVQADEQRRIDTERAAAAKAEADRKAAADAAKSSNLRTTANRVTNGSGAPKGTMEQTMREKLDELMPDG